MNMTTSVDHSWIQYRLKCNHPHTQNDFRFNSCLPDRYLTLFGFYHNPSSDHTAKVDIHLSIFLLREMLWSLFTNKNAYVGLEKGLGEALYRDANTEWKDAYRGVRKDKEETSGIFSTGEVSERDPRKQGALLEKKVQLEPWRGERVLTLLAWRDGEIKHTVLSCCKLCVMSVMEMIEILTL